MHQVVMVLHSLEVRKSVLYPELDYERFGIEDPRLITVDNKNYVTYVVLFGLCEK